MVKVDHPNEKLDGPRKSQRGHFRQSLQCRTIHSTIYRNANEDCGNVRKSQLDYVWSFHRCDVLPKCPSDESQDTLVDVNISLVVEIKENYTGVMYNSVSVLRFYMVYQNNNTF
uniref:Uncharacterized protein n=1 Tax=Vespula pensylvanica TaxID=30213 RepID=A0A834PFM9_VESPE|nr:hypothetical protein H0235_001319 [Vespula pensylvanica]